MADLCTQDHLNRAISLRRLISVYTENQDLIMMGGYIKCQDADLDLAVDLWPKIVNFLAQEKADRYPFDELETLFSELLG